MQVLQLFSLMNKCFRGKCFERVKRDMCDFPCQLTLRFYSWHEAKAIRQTLMRQDNRTCPVFLATNRPAATGLAAPSLPPPPANRRRQAKNVEVATPRDLQNTVIASPEQRCSSINPRHLASPDSTTIETDSVVFMPADHAPTNCGGKMGLANRSHFIRLTGRDRPFICPADSHRVRPAGRPRRSGWRGIAHTGLSHRTPPIAGRD